MSKSNYFSGKSVFGQLISLIDDKIIKNGSCHKSQTNRIIEINVNLQNHKQKPYDLFNTKQRIRHRKKRCYDVEPVFANIQQNHGFRRFMLRGKQKVEIEWGLLAIAQNIRKKAA